MKIHLKNFLCYTDQTFDFGDNGLTLISGNSGTGKTSIMRAIFFALFGDGTKVQSYGKPSCSVQLDFEDMQIVRTKKPNRLVLNDVYEDESAQAIINTRFGSTFRSSGYIQQNNLNSFILLSPTDKLEFLEKFAFQDVDLGKIKARCKAHISKLYDELLGINAQLDMGTKILEQLKEPVKISFPLKCKAADRDLAIKNEHTKLKNTCTHISKAEKDKTKIERELNDLEVLNATIQAQKDFIVILDAKIDIKESTIEYVGNIQLALMETNLQQIVDTRELRQLEATYAQNISKLEKMALTEIHEFQKEIDTINETLWSEYTQEDLTSTLEDSKACLVDANTLERLRKELKLHEIPGEDDYQITVDKYVVTLEERQTLLQKLKTQKDLYTCPECKVCLRIDGTILRIVSDKKIAPSDYAISDCMEDIRKLQRVVTEAMNILSNRIRLEKDINAIVHKYDEISDSVSLQEDITYLHHYQVTQKQQEKRRVKLLDNIENNKLSTFYDSVKNDTDDLCEKISNMKIGICGSDINTHTEDELRALVFEQKQNKIALANIKRQKDDIAQEKKRCLTIIETAQHKYMEKYGECEEDKDNLKKLLVDNKLKIETLFDLKRIHEGNLSLIETWQRYQEEIHNYDDWKSKVSVFKSREKDCRSRYTAGMTLKNKILEAESISITNIIDTINMHARGYLDCFFTDSPISVQLQAFKETKKSTKPSINVVIEYKSMECDLNMLSGGELSRVVLAYTLALSEMFNTPLLLLDECTASLDQELTNVVFDGIRENFNGKLVLIVAHQVIVGTFDKIITLTP